MGVLTFLRVFECGGVLCRDSLLFVLVVCYLFAFCGLKNMVTASAVFQCPGAEQCLSLSPSRLALPQGPGLKKNGKEHRRGDPFPMREGVYVLVCAYIYDANGLI